MRTRNRRSKRHFEDFHKFLRYSAEICFQESNFPKSYPPPIRGSSWHKNEIKMIRRGYYSSNNFQDSTKIKSTEKKTLGYLPRVLFFNAFELGAESGNQVFSNEGALRSIGDVFLTRNCILSK
jgi:hypothetical protein